MSTPVDDGVFEMGLNGHQLSGVKADGVWAFTCPDWPDLAAKWSGDTVLTNAVEEFSKRAFADAATLRVLRQALGQVDVALGGEPEGGGR